MKWGVWCTPKRGRSYCRKAEWLIVGRGLRLEFKTKREATVEADNHRHAFDDIPDGSAWTYHAKKIQPEADR